MENRRLEKTAKNIHNDVENTIDALIIEIEELETENSKLEERIQLLEDELNNRK